MYKNKQQLVSKRPCVWAWLVKFEVFVLVVQYLTLSRWLKVSDWKSKSKGNWFEFEITAVQGNLAQDSEVLLYRRKYTFVAMKYASRGILFRA